MHAAEAGPAARGGALPGARRPWRGRRTRAKGVKVADCIHSLRSGCRGGSE